MISCKTMLDGGRGGTHVERFRLAKALGIDTLLRTVVAIIQREIAIRRSMAELSRAGDRMLGDIDLMRSRDERLDRF